MAVSYNSFMSKGLIENCSPSRSDYLFGAVAGDFDVSGWNCLPIAWDATVVFDCSALEPYHEVALVTATVLDAPASGEVNFNFKWYRTAGTGDKFFEIDVPLAVSAGSYAYAYSYVGWFPHEIINNGSAYHVVITISGASTSYSNDITFTISGIQALSANAGHIWVEGTYLHWIDSKERRVMGTLDTAGSFGLGHLWVEYIASPETWGLWYVDDQGDVRRIPMTNWLDLPGSPVDGHLWIQTGAFFCQIYVGWLWSIEGAAVV